MNDMRTQVTASLERMVEMWRRDAEQLGELLGQRLASGDITAAETEALTAHRNLKALI